IAEAELVEDVCHVGLDRVFAEVERGRNLGVRLAAGDELEDLEFARRERAERRGVAAVRPVLVGGFGGEAGCGAGGEEGGGGGNKADAVGEVFGPDVLQEET